MNDDKLKKKRGRKSEYTNDQLRALALKVKEKAEGMKITYQILERETGIGRNTWARRIPEYIDKLNNLLLRDPEMIEGENVYLPSISEILEKFGVKNNKLIMEMFEFERTLQITFKKLQELKKELKCQKEMQAEIKILTESNKRLTNQRDYYKDTYQSLVLSSIYPHLREEYGIIENLLDFKVNTKENSKILYLDSFFSAKNNDEIKRKEAMLKNTLTNIWDEEGE